MAHVGSILPVGLNLSRGPGNLDWLMLGRILPVGLNLTCGPDNLDWLVLRAQHMESIAKHLLLEAIRRSASFLSYWANLHIQADIWTFGPTNKVSVEDASCPKMCSFSGLFVLPAPGHLAYSRGRSYEAPCKGTKTKENT